jgi:outer membrane receptor protein involved in Fe transport
MPQTFKNVFVLRSAILLFWIPISTLGQDATETGTTVFTLDPFTVETENVQGYLATTAMTATKIGTAIKETPLNVQVMTSEFLEDAALLNFAEITQYSSSFSQDAVNGSNFNSVLNAGQRGDQIGPNDISGTGRVGITPPNGIRLRAFPISNILRNGLPRAGNHSLKGVDRVEVVKGPVAIFFGQSQPGGAINYMTKRPLDTPEYTVRTRVGDYQLRSVELDANLPVGEQLGMRFLGSWQDTDDWRYFTTSTEEYAGLVLSWRPVDWLTIIVEGEFLERTDNPAGSPIVTNALYHNDFFNPPDALLFLPQDSAYGRNPWNRGFGREDTLRRWQQTILRNRDNWVNARVAAFPEEGYPDVVNQYFFDGVEVYERNRDSFESALAAVYGADANLAGPYGYSNNLSETAYYEVTARPLSWLSMKASGNYGDGSRKFRLMGANMPYGDMTFAGTSVNAGQEENTYSNHIFDTVFSFNLFGSPQKIITGGELRTNEGVRWKIERSWTTELTQIYKEWDPRTADYPPLEIIYPLKSEEPDVVGIFDLSNSQAPELLYTRMRRLGSYLMHQGEFIDGKLHTMAGIRHENQEEESKGVISRDWVNQGRTSGTSKAIGFVYELTDWINGYASWNQNYQPNTRFSVEASDIGDYNQQDLNERQWLDDETGTGIDLGFKFETLNEKVTGQLSYFEIEREGISRLDYQRSLQRMLDEGWTDDAFRVRYYVNGGLERARGFESEILANPLPGWQLLASFTYYFQAEVVSDPSLADFQADKVIRNGLPNVSKQRLSLWSNYEFRDGALDGFSFGGGLRYAGSSKPFVYNWQYSITNASYTVYDARLAYSFNALGAGWKLALNVKNVTDEHYSSGGLGFSPPRTYVLSLDCTF